MTHRNADLTIHKRRIGEKMKRIPALFFFACVNARLLLAADAPPAPIAADAAPEDILRAFDSRWAALKDYSCSLDTKVRRGEKETHDVLDYAFKKPALWKSRVVKGADEGSTVARGADGKIRARAGGALGIIAITMKEDDARLKDPRGATLNEADWGFIARQFQKRRGAGWTFERLPDERIRGVDCAIVQAAGKADAMGETREALAFDKATLALKARRLWEGEAQVDDTVYDRVKLDQGLTDEFFKP